MEQPEHLKGVKRTPGKQVKWRNRVNLFCKECIYDPACGSGTWRKQVEDCTSTNCPLYDIRPTSTPKRNDDGADIEEADE